MTTIAMCVAMVGSALVVRWLFSSLVRGVPDGSDYEAEVKLPFVTVRRKVQRTDQRHPHADTVPANKNDRSPIQNQR
jgi:hypothetical protein